MAKPAAQRVFTLLQRELQEYRVSLVWTPLIIAGLLSLAMLFSVFIADRLSANGQPLLDMIMQENVAQGMKITIHMDDKTDPPVEPEYQVTPEQGSAGSEEWDFSRDWDFNPAPRPRGEYDSEEVSGNLNPMLNIVHTVLLMVLMLVSAHYLLGCLYNDRKDRSILFWKSMPVSEWEEVLARFALALVVVPAIFIAVSLLLQMVFILLAMLLAVRSDMDPFEVVLANVQFGRLLADQLGGWLLTALWVAPACAWLMLASAAARRSPFMLALAPIVGLVVAESLLLGSDFVADAVLHHIPHYIGGESSVGFYQSGPFWVGQDWLGLALGLVFTVLALGAAVYLRRYRFEI